MRQLFQLDVSATGGALHTNSAQPAAATIQDQQRAEHTHYRLLDSASLQVFGIELRDFLPDHA